MANDLHGSNKITKIKLPNGNTYEICDPLAVHIGDITAIMDFKGSKTDKTAIDAITNQKKGDVWLDASTGNEWIWDGSSWMKLGMDIEAASTTHTHIITNLKGTNASSTVTGQVSVPTVTPTTKNLGITIGTPSVSPTTKNVVGADATFTSRVTPETTNIKATASGTAVGANGTANAITALSNFDTKVVLGEGTTFAVSGGEVSTSNLATTTIKNPSVSGVTIPNVTGNSDVTASKISANTTVTIPNVTGNTEVTASKVSVTGGTPATFGATVSDGVLEISWTTNTPTAVTANDVKASKVTLGTALTASKVTASDVTASKVTLGTALSASKVTTSNVTVATGSLSSTGSGAPVATGISAIEVTVDNKDAVAAVTGFSGTHTTATVLKGVKVTAQPTIKLATGATAGDGVISVATGIQSAAVAFESKDTIAAVTNVSVGAPQAILTDTGTTGIGFVSSVAVGSTTKDIQNGSAAAQKWTFSPGDGQTGGPNN